LIKKFWFLLFTIFLIPLSGQNNAGEVDSNLVKVEKSKPGFLSLFNDPADTNTIQEPISVDSSALANDSVVNDSLNEFLTEPTNFDSKEKSNKFQSNKFERFEDLQIKYRTDVQPEEKKRIEKAIGRYLQPSNFNVSVKKVTAYSENFDAARNSLPGVLNVIRKDMPQIISQKLEITLDVDTSKSTGDYSFFKNLVSSVVSLDEDDIVDINFWEFPDNVKEIISKKKNLPLPVSVAPTPAPFIDSNSLKSSQEKVVQSQNNDMLEELLARLDEQPDTIITQAPRSEGMGSKGMTGDAPPWTLIAVSVLALVIIIFLIFMLLRSRSEQNAKAQQKQDDLELSSIGLKQIAEGTFEESTGGLKKEEFKVHLLEHPEAVASFLTQMIEQNNEEAMTVFSSLARPYSDLVGMCKPFMTYNQFLMVLATLDAPSEEKIDPASVDKFLVTFNSAIKVLSRKKNSDRSDIKGGKVFGFLDQLTDSQISSLLGADKPEIASVVFAQLNKDRKLNVLDSIDDDLRTNILIALSDIKSLPLSVIKDIGIRYAKKAREVAGLEDINVDGLKALLETLDELDIKRQIAIIDTMRANDLQKGERLEKMFIGINGLMNIEEDVLRTALNDVDTQNLINALHGLEQELIDHVLKARPPRERELIKSELGATNSIAQKDQISSRRDILQEVRKIMKS
jgi:uncharacterized membrane protein